MSKTIDIKPVTGYMDMRSTPDEVPFGGYRYVLNAGVIQKNRLARSRGWDRLLTRDGYNNQDLHDQLLSLSSETTPIREPITFLFEARSTRKTTKLLAGTANRLYALNISSGNWKILWDKQSAGAYRIYADQLDDTTVLTNDLDPVQYWSFDQPNDAQGQSVQPIPDLTAINLSRAGVVIQWNGIMILANVVQDGQVFGNRLVWSDYKKPLSFRISSASLAGNHDLTSGESILAIRPMASVLLIYTTLGIWEMTAVGGTDVFAFTKRYDPGRQGEACLAYKNAIATSGNQHMFLSHDGIYVYDLYHDKPDRTDWIHRGSSVITDDINKAVCDAHNAGYRSETKEVIFSWATAGSSTPDKTFIVNTEFPFTNVLDHGLTAQVTWIPHEPLVTVKDFLLQNCICSPTDFNTYFGDLITKEGGFCEAQSNPTCPTPPQSIYTVNAKTLAGVGDDADFQTEDYDQPGPDADSLCAQLAGASIASLCTDTYRADQCNADPLYVVASATDLCLKQLSENMYREMCTAFSACGTYSKNGYRTILRSGPIALNTYTDEKLIRRFIAEMEAAMAIVPAQVVLRIGTASQALDPNTSTKIHWSEEDPKDVLDMGPDEAVQDADGSRTDNILEWGLFSQGMYVYFELTILNANVTPQDTGGEMSFSRFTFEADRIGRSY